MGTTPEWMHVLEYGGTFGLLVLVFDAMRTCEAAIKWPNLVITAFISLALGMVEVFGWRVFHGGISALFWAALLATFGTGFVARRAQKRAEIASDTSLHN
jgi:hypothetical protein